MGFDKWHSEMYSPLQYYTAWFSSPKNTLCSTNSSLLSSLSTTDFFFFFFFFTLSTVLPFPGCHVIGTMQYGAFSDCVLSLNTLLSFLCVFSWLDGSFFLITGKYFIMWMCHDLFTHSPIEGHLGCFQVLAIMKRVAINIHMQVFI